MPPTMSDTAAMLARRVVKRLDALLLGAGHLGQIANAEVVVGANGSVVAIAQQGGNLILRAGGGLARHRADHERARDELLQATLNLG